MFEYVLRCQYMLLFFIFYFFYKQLSVYTCKNVDVYALSLFYCPSIVLLCICLVLLQYNATGAQKDKKKNI